MTNPFVILPQTVPTGTKAKYPWSRKIAAALRFPLLRAANYPTLVNLEVTHRCNARCDFCRYWTTKSEQVLTDYAPVVRKLKPLALVFTGGEALLRPDIVQLVAGVRKASPSVYLSMVTNGWLLSVSRALALWDAGLDQITISLDFLDERHDRARGIPGLTARILSTVPLLKERGIDNIVLQTFIRRDNLDAVLDVVTWAKQNGVKASVSTFTPMKTGDDQYSLTPSQMPALRILVDRLVKLKKEGWPITSSTYYLNRIPEFFSNGEVDGCLAGRRFVGVTPSGEIQACSEMPVECMYTEWKPGRFGRTECGGCWVPCRGENQAPINWERVRQAVGAYHGRLDGVPALQDSRA
ncbi:MAG TPA: radical SAM protein [Paludibaculum sp.]|jgi:MoaA/NifB/PqqE/SkfB family radical SAM enzyme